MTVKLVVLYTKPEDTDAFDRHYFDIHLPLVHKIPGLRRAETGRFIDVLGGGEQSFYRVAELYFPDQATMDAGIASDQGKATAADYAKIAPPGSRMFVESLHD
ncbi:MAG TPA: EthD family reductase [Streptosporangiaceae bacterium]